ncbi:hypothetical protein PX554_12730 [Sphingomonas sp. H39-1-10]|uniref:hypothetical protein n=1 Tax=Sphingomonas pollutisoli TaxID=3030829 RepID=UPI0023B9A60D|nr:hypothetical protein [Sphingomonas pollutisoli]MDF0489001.1 hypothetical protein [Sphingomonas pollutisoli]
MFALLLLLQFPNDIVVTGQRLVEAQEECARGGCSPLRDAQTTIALAEVKFREGAYVEAKHLLATAISRNRNKAAEAPRPVAALYEAYATVALHDGDQTTYRRAVANQVQTLRENLPANDPSVVSAATALGDMWIELGNYRQADATYRRIEDDALDAGQAKQAMLAGMKRVWLAAAMGKKADSSRKLNELEARPIAKESGFKTALRVLRLRLAVREENGADITKRIRELGQGEDAEPVLIWAPPYQLDAAAAANANARKFSLSDAVDIRSTDWDGNQWVDIGFWIRPDGHTAEAEILRGSRSQSWAKSALNQIARRRYTISGADTERQMEEGVYRVERFTRKSEYITPKGSLIKRRVAVGGFEVLDLTKDPKDPPSN